MNLLLDTHAALWFALDDSSLSKKAKAAILADDAEVFLSPASYWEIAIKISLGKYQLAAPFDEFWHQAIQVGELNVLPVSVAHAQKVSQLPLIHRDPFDHARRPGPRRKPRDRQP